MATPGRKFDQLVRETPSISVKHTNASADNRLKEISAFSSSVADVTILILISNAAS